MTGRHVRFLRRGNPENARKVGISVFRLHAVGDMASCADPMAGITLTRPRLLATGLAVVLGVGGAMWLYQPDRQLRRSWNDLLATVEARNTTRLGRIIAEDYADRWGYQRRPLLEDARMAFMQFRRLEVRAEQVHIERTDDHATITAILRVDAEGPGSIGDARASINALFTPFVFEWRREPGFTGAWKLVRFDHPEFDLARYRPRW